MWMWHGVKISELLLSSIIIHGPQWQPQARAIVPPPPRKLS